MTNLGNTKPKAAYLSGAARSVLELPLGATAPEVHRRAIALLNQEELQLPLPTFEAVTVLGLGQPPNPVHFPILRQMSSGAAHELEDEIDEFRTSYFKLPPTERQTRWADLRRRCADYPFLLRRLTLLEQGLGLEPDVSHLSPDLQDLAEAVLRMYTSTPREQARIRAKRREIAERILREPKNAAELKRLAPEITALAEKLIDELANWSPETRRRREKARDRREKELGRQSGIPRVWQVAIVIFIVANGIGMLSQGGGAKSPQRRAKQRWIPPVNSSPRTVPLIPATRLPDVPGVDLAAMPAISQSLDSTMSYSPVGYEEAKRIYLNGPVFFPHSREKYLVAVITYGGGLARDGKAVDATNVYERGINVGRTMLRWNGATLEMQRLQARLLGDCGIHFAQQLEWSQAALCFAECLGVVQPLVDSPLGLAADDRMRTVALKNMRGMFQSIGAPNWRQSFAELWCRRDKYDDSVGETEAAWQIARGFALASQNHGRTLSESEQNQIVSAAAELLLVPQLQDKQHWQEVRQENYWQLVREVPEVQKLLETYEAEDAVPIAPQVSNVEVFGKDVSRDSGTESGRAES